MDHVKITVESFLSLIEDRNKLKTFELSNTVSIRTVFPSQVDIVYTDDEAVEKLAVRLKNALAEIDKLAEEINHLRKLKWYNILFK